MGSIMGTGVVRRSSSGRAWIGLFLATTGLSSPALAQETEPAPPQSIESEAREPDRNANDIVVTGTLIRGLDNRLPVPVTVITQDDLVARGYTSVADALARSSTATGSVPDAAQGYTQGARTVSLFGFAPGFTKFLIEGRPAANYPALYNNQSVFVDIGAVPSALIETVEVLPGGQSSLYGSDAIAGVVNIQLKRKLDGPMAEARLGLYERGGGRSMRFALADGLASGGFSMIAGLQYEDIQPIWSFQRRLTRSNFDRGSSPWEPSGVFSLQRADFSYVSPPEGSCDAVTGLYDNGVALHVMPDGGSYCANLRKNIGTLMNREKRLQGFAHASYDLGGGDEIYGDILVNRSSSRYIAAILPRGYFSPYFHSEALGETFRLTRDYSPEEVGGLTPQMSRDRLDSAALTGGVRGTIGDDWAYDVSVQHTRQDLSMARVAYLREPVEGFFNSILGPELGEYDDPMLGPVSIREPDFARFFQPIPTSVVDGFLDTYRAKARTRMTWGRALASNKSLFALPGGNAAAAFAVEGATESWHYEPDARAGTGAFFQELSDVSGDGSRKSLAAVGELQLPIVDFASLSGSLRYDQYFTFARNTGKASWNVAAQVRPLGEIMSVHVRYGTAFKAPTLADLYQGESSAIGASTDYRRCAELGFPIGDTSSCPFRGATFTLRNAGNRELRPLTAQVLNVGATLTPVKGIDIDINYLRWRIDDGVTNESVDTLLLEEARCAATGADPARCAQIASAVARAPDGTLLSVLSAKRNLSKSWIEALDVQGSASQEIGDIGRFTLTGGWTYLLNRRSQSVAGAQIIDEIADPQYTTTPRTKLNSWLGWHRKSVDLNLGFERSGTTPNFLAVMGGYGNGGARLPGWTVWTLSGNVQMTTKLNLSLAINNLFDSDPPLDTSTLGFSNVPFASNGNVNGRQFLLQMNHGF